MAIGPGTSALEIAAVVSQALVAQGIQATLSGGGAVSIYTRNAYQSHDLDFVCSEGQRVLARVLAPLGFRRSTNLRHFEHADTDFVLEFPPAPLQFGDQIVSPEAVPDLQTPWGPLRVITPTQCVMDRLAAFWHWQDRQAWDQAVLVARHQAVDFRELENFARREAGETDAIHRLRTAAAGQS